MGQIICEDNLTIKMQTKKRVYSRAQTEGNEKKVSNAILKVWLYNMVLKDTNFSSARRVPKRVYHRRTITLSERLPLLIEIYLLS